MYGDLFCASHEKATENIAVIRTDLVVFKIFLIRERRQYVI